MKAKRIKNSNSNQVASEERIKSFYLAKTIVNIRLIQKLFPKKIKILVSHKIKSIIQ